MSPGYAAGIPTQGTWSTTLLPRDLDGNLTTAEAYYDTVLNTTWLRDANFAFTSQFGLTLSASEFDDTPGTVGSTGRMTWFNAIAWIAGMNAANFGGVNQWRLPITKPIDFSTSDDANYSYNGIEDRGYNVGAPGTGYAGNSTASEMSHMSHYTLGNLGYCDPVASSLTYCSPLQTGWGITNTGPFDNIKTSDYWSATDYTPVDGSAWLFNFRFGDQDGVNKLVNRYAWAVHPGDVGTPTAHYVGDGDVAPLNAPDGVVNVADLLVAARITMNLVEAGALQLAHGDVYPPDNPDGVINLQDLILIQRIALQ
ncbi:MAG: DUF1566 domain-containing protein [Gammaproteobacteria bacterium]|nr:DUF1566 domain-containing protein [Gammaproteobacteria bacterium]